MVIYETSKRSSFVASRMATFFLLGGNGGGSSVQGLAHTIGGGSSSSGRNSHRTNWNTTTATAAAGVGLIIFLLITGNNNGKSTNKKKIRSIYDDDDDDVDDRDDSLNVDASSDSLIIKNNSDENDKDEDEDDDASVTTLYYFCRSLLRTFVESLSSVASSTDEDPLLVEARLRTLAKARQQQQLKVQRLNDDTTITSHTGSCQCNAVKFRVRAPRTLYVYQGKCDSSSAIQYPQVKIVATDFKLKNGGNHLQSFQSTIDTGNGTETKAAHTFCSRCGVHLLHATQSSKYVYLNVLTLRKGSFIQKVASTLDIDDDYINDNQGMKSPHTFNYNDYQNLESKASMESSSSDDFVDTPSLYTQTRNIDSPPESPYSSISKVEQHSFSLKKQSSTMSSTESQVSDNNKDNRVRLNSDRFDETRSIRSTQSSRSYVMSRSRNRGGPRRYSTHQNSSSRDERILSAPLNHDHSAHVDQRNNANSSHLRSTNNRRNSYAINRSPLGINGSVVEMDALSVASSISDNMYSTSHLVDSGSVYTRGTASSRRSIESVEQSHGQLRRYLAKHVKADSSTGSTSPLPTTTEKSTTTTPTATNIMTMMNNNPSSLYDGAIAAVAQLELEQSSSMDI